MFSSMLNMLSSMKNMFSSMLKNLTTHNLPWKQPLSLTEKISITLLHDCKKAKR